MQLESTILNTLDEQTRAGGGWLLFDFTGASEHLHRVRHVVCGLHREHQLHLVDFVERSESETLDLLHGSPADIAASLVSMLPPVQLDNPGAMYYRQKAYDAFEALLGALQASGESITFSRLSMLLMSSSAIRDLEARVRKCDNAAYQRLVSFLDELHSGNPPTAHAEAFRVNEVLGGAAGRIAQLWQGGLGAILDSPQPGIRISAVVEANRMLYVRLPAYEALAQQIARLISSELTNSLKLVGGEPTSEQTGRPFLKFELFA